MLKRLRFLPSFAILLLFISCSEDNSDLRNRINLRGSWQFALDTAKIGIKEGWYRQNLTDSIQLPGTTDSNQKGLLNTDTTTKHLNRIYKYEEAAWYQKKLVIPESFRDQSIHIHFERSKCSEVWIDDLKIGESKLLQSPQVFEATQYLTPGEHTLTVKVDNSLKLTPYGHVHIYSDDTQTNWNGLLGDLYIEAKSKTYISNLQVYPDVDQKEIDILMAVNRSKASEKLKVELQIKQYSKDETIVLPSRTYDLTSGTSDSVLLSYDFEEVALWDEYEQPIYELTAILTSMESQDSYSVPFGMRKFEAKGTQFKINDRTTFLRGKHEAGVFPLTGHVPMDVESWVRVYEIAKSYGINHYRFHSYCPPEAAFTAADQVGIYIQAELPFWGGLESDTVALALREEGYAMLKAYANHPSFVLFSHGNEIWSGHDRTEENIAALKAYDDRPLYTFGSNNSIGYQPPSRSSEFFVAARNPIHGDSILGHTRLTHAFADAEEGATLNTQTPNTTVNFDFAISNVKVPLVSHEIGQYQVYPDYREIDKYTGVLKAWNLEVFKDSLEKAGMLDLDSIFQKASGAWSALCYKAEMETALRTKDMAGFQLLDLQDFPGQGTALVGILDAFMDDKGVVSKEEWLQSCNDVVILGEFSKFVWTNEETLEATIKIANYSNHDISSPFNWKLTSADEQVIDQGSIESEAFMGQLNEAGEINIDLASIQSAKQLTLHLEIPHSNYSNQYPIWVYPVNEITGSEAIIIAKKLNNEVWNELDAGGQVLLFPMTEDIVDKSVAGHFPPEFWNYGMFKGISEWAKKPISPGTLGLLMDPEHPIFNSFPTDFHTKWQWFSIIKASRSLYLNKTAIDYRPIVQVIDNLERNYKMGMIFEFKVGKGKLLVCTADLFKIQDKPEARQLFNSILSYMESEVFNPSYEINSNQLKELL
ncbi:sugar-binding domain-containing protein [Reichenbachiella ulvae]|uniref:Beta-galactosidase n=1 Tax=Reichenbachiella ulvae TaxID=2980104 RepID=A0ABT3CTR8_9BACT|nr:sugar-binding domain-containing protein [Reichenbachiella ulvae]MCV9387014.1 hypothetical protein [Reichenbachiella ulvae]